MSKAKGLQRSERTLVSYTDEATGFCLAEVDAHNVVLSRKGQIVPGTDEPVRLIFAGPFARALAELEAFFGDRTEGASGIDGFLRAVSLAERSVAAAAPSSEGLQ